MRVPGLIGRIASPGPPVPATEKKMKTVTALLLLLLLLSPLLAEPCPIETDRQRVDKPIPDKLSFLGHNGVNGGHLMDVVLSGDRAYVLVGVSNGLETYDISNPANPVRIKRQGSAAWNAGIDGNRLYVFNREHGFEIYDISGGTPTLLGEYDPSNPDILYENGVPDGNTLYVAAHQEGVVVFDVSNPSNIVLTDTIKLADNACWDVEKTGSRLAVANGRFGISTVDLTLPPSEIAALSLPGLTNHIVLDGTVAVLSLGGFGIATVDVSVPASPALLDTARSKGNPFGSGLFEHKLAVGSWSALEVFDVADPSRIRREAFDDTATWALGADIQSYGNGAIVAIADWRGMSTYLLEPDSVADIEVTPNRLDFGEVTLSEDAEVTVWNRGAAGLNVTVSNIPSGIQVSPGSFTVPPGDSRKVTVTATGSGSVMGSLRYNSNDPDESSYTQYVYKNNTSFPQTDSMAPEFLLADIDGYWRALSDYRGRVVFLEFGELW
jgi:hypothetical protein